MKCKNCNGDITADDYCICTGCRTTVCPKCAEKEMYVCSECGGDIAYLS